MLVLRDNYYSSPLIMDEDEYLDEILFSSSVIDEDEYLEKMFTIPKIPLKNVRTLKNSMHEVTPTIKEIIRSSIRRSGTIDAAAHREIDAALQKINPDDVLLRSAQRRLSLK